MLKYNTPEVPLHINKPVEKPKVTPHIPKGILKCLGHNLNSQSSQHYSIVEDLGKTPCAISALEFLQIFPLHRKALLTALDMVDSNPSTTVRFETHEVQPHLYYHVAFLVHVECMNNTIK